MEYTPEPRVRRRQVGHEAAVPEATFDQVVKDNLAEVGAGETSVGGSSVDHVEMPSEN